MVTGEWVTERTSHCHPVTLPESIAPTFPYVSLHKNRNRIKNPSSRPRAGGHTAESRPYQNNDYTEVGKAYGAIGLPATYFVDESGVVTAVHRGILTGSQIEGYLAQTLP